MKQMTIFDLIKEETRINPDVETLKKKANDKKKRVQKTLKRKD